MSDKAISELTEMRDKVLTIIDDSIRALKTRDRALAETIKAQENAIDELEKVLRTITLKG